MWLFMPDFFISAVANKKEPGTISIRGRVKGDVIRFLSPVMDITTEIECAGTDYAVRQIVTQTEFEDALKYWASQVTYPNFKDAVRENVRHDAYFDVWRVMHKLQNYCNPIKWVGNGMKLCRGNSISSLTNKWNSFR